MDSMGTLLKVVLIGISVSVAWEALIPSMIRRYMDRGGFIAPRNANAREKSYNKSCRDHA